MQKIRRALSLDDDINDEENILADATPPAQPRDIHGVMPQPVTHLRRSDEGDRQAAAQQPAQTPAEPSPQNDDAPARVCPEAIFNTVVNLFDNSLPSFIGDNLDRDAQCSHIYELLDESVRKYIDDVRASAEAECRTQFSRERTRMLAEMEQLRQDNRSAKESGESCKQQQLSAERQKRALAERVRDLEQQVTAMSAEREQFELENKSLVNKLRLVSVQEGDADALRQENTELRARLQQLRAAGEADTEAQPDAALQSKLDEALGQLDEAGARAEAAETEAAELREQLEALTADRQQLQKVYDELKSKEEMTDVMINDLNSRASEAQRELAETRAELEAAGDAAGRVAQLSAQCDNLRQANESLKAETERGKAAVELLAEVQEQFDKLEQSRKAREERINDLLDQLDVKDEEIDDLNRRIAELNDTLANTRADFEARLRQRSAEATGGADDAAPFDPSLDDTDWLVATPPPGTAVRTPGVTDDEFGYHEPKRRKSASDDPAQMSLFD